MFKKTFGEETIQAVWEKGQEVSSWDSTKFRKDKCGAPITHSQYGNIDSDEGWEIDHINPDGSDHISNLRPLQWANNRAKSDNRDGGWTCAIRG
ncbi:MAG: HNH endonuclease [Candidatus Zambryskibacteria bacterium]|nr:HNH endonuclease [Candidatus Zambryskibacteria bacterium]